MSSLTKLFQRSIVKCSLSYMEDSVWIQVLDGRAMVYLLLLQSLHDGRGLCPQCICTCVCWLLEDIEQDESQEISKLKKKIVKFGEVRQCYDITELWNQKEVPTSKWSVEIRVLCTLAQGQRQDPKRRYIHIRDRRYGTGNWTSGATSCCHQKHLEAF